MIKTKDLVPGNKFFYMTEISESPHLVAIVGPDELWHGHIVIRFNNGRQQDIKPMYLYHSKKEAMAAHPPQEHMLWARQRRRHWRTHLF